MTDAATEFTIKSKWTDEDQHDVFIPGRRKPVNSIDKVSGEPHLRVRAGADLKYIIGFIGDGEAYNSDRQQIGYSWVDPDVTNWPDEPGIFEQNGLGTLYRQVSTKEVGPLTRTLRKTPGLRALMRDCAPLSIHYSSPESPGFTMTIPRGVLLRCHVTIHDDRISRTQMLSTYLRERRKGVALDVMILPFGLLLYPLSWFGD
ncbi:MAG: hypothetical protein J2P18_01115 [Nocardia sp.]|nr:hypothetical protein [Nocardia sp.]